jgi:hypothetical protein
LTSLPPELRVWVEELLDELKRIGIFVATQGVLGSWPDADPAADPAASPHQVLQALDRGECPAGLRSLVAEVTAFARASAGVAAAARG